MPEYGVDENRDAESGDVQVVGVKEQHERDGEAGTRVAAPVHELPVGVDDHNGQECGDRVEARLTGEEETIGKPYRRVFATN